jgi:hypothetical protein
MAYYMLLSFSLFSAIGVVVNADWSLVSIGWTIFMILSTIIYIRVIFTMCGNAQDLANERSKVRI